MHARCMEPAVHQLRLKYAARPPSLCACWHLVAKHAAAIYCENL